MEHNRRKFIKVGVAGLAGMAAGCVEAGGDEAAAGKRSAAAKGPIILSTWRHGMEANAEALKVFGRGGSVVDAVEAAVAVVESDLSNRSVGQGGRPDRDGHVTLDASIQDHEGRAGAVAFVEGFEHPISIARAVMEKTPHVLLVGAGAERWALENGFSRREVALPEVRREWQEWLKTGQYAPPVNVENHDTIGLVAMDAQGRLAGSCTTSGLAYKVHGRVGDSPIIGAGLFVDGEVGAACATGVGELVIKVAGSHAVVELMRQGLEPTDACREVVQRIMRKNPGLKDAQVGFLALRNDGAHGAWAVYHGFDHALTVNGNTELVMSGYEREWE